MIRAIRAELVKHRRRSVLQLIALATVVLSVGGALVVVTAAEPAATATRGPGGRSITVESLSAAGGGTQVFSTVISFIGTFLFVVFVGVVAAEFSRGTMRTMLLRQPDRRRLLVGKTLATLGVAAVVLAVTEVLTWVAALLLAPGQDIATDRWTSLDALGHAVGDYGTALFWVSGYAVLATMVGVLIRSVPAALAVGIAWAGPFEHLLQDGWSAASRWFPGLLLEALAAGGTDDVSATRAFVSVAAYVVLAAAVALTSFQRRDVAGA